MIELEGTPSDDLPAVLATGTTDVNIAVVSMSERAEDGDDAGYIEWHSLDHRPEQYRLPGLRRALRIVSTPECRAARAASAPMFDAVDHVMTYLFADAAALPAFFDLGAALGAGGRMPVRLPKVQLGGWTRAGGVAAARAVAGIDVLPWRPARGVYLVVEQGEAVPPHDLVEVPGVAGAWSYEGSGTLHRRLDGTTGLRLVQCFLDDDPVAVAARLGPVLRQRWSAGGVEPLLAAPFHTLVPFDWGRHLP